MLTFAWKDLLHHRGQTLLNIFGLAVVIFTYLILAALAQTMDGLIQGNNPSRILMVIQKEVIDPSDATVSSEVQQAVEELIPASVSRIAPVIFRHIRINDHLVQLRAAPLTAWEPVFHLTLVEGRWPSPRREAAIGEGAARANGWGLDTVLRIYGSDFRVVGIFRSPTMVFASVWLPLEAAQDLFAPRRASQILFIQTTPGGDPELVRSRLQSDPRLVDQFAVYFEEYYTRYYTQIFADIALLLRVVSLIALLSVTFGVYNATSLNLVERSRELGILRSVGFGTPSVLLFLLLRALLLGLLAYAAGLAAAYAFAAQQAATEPLFVLGAPLVYTVNFGNAIAALGWIALLAPLGAGLAARQNLRTTVAGILRGLA